MPYTSKQNGVTERKNRPIIETTHAMFHDQNLSKFLWGEATNVIVYVQNRVPHQALDKKIPEGVFTGAKPDVSHIHIFGCPVYFYVPKEKRNKLRPLEENVCLLDIVKIIKHLEYILLIKGRLKLARMLHSMKMSPLEKKGTFLRLLLLRRTMIWTFR